MDGPARDEPAGEGGEAACWAHLLCPDCGAVLPGPHRDGCAAAPGAAPDPR